VFEPQRQRATLLTYPLLFSDEERRPLGVILDESNNTRVKTQSVSHRIQLETVEAITTTLSWTARRATRGASDGPRLRSSDYGDSEKEHEQCRWESSEQVMLGKP
jgi:hypothetical protein